MTRFICAFNRDRDGYQVPLALAEADGLGRLVTDYYEGASWPRLRSLSHRQVEGVDPGLVSVSTGAFVPQLGYELAKRIRPQVRFPADLVDDAIARSAARAARRDPEADLLLYSSYAHTAFAAAGSRRRFLFQYHPGETAVREALATPTDFDVDIGWIPEPETYSENRRRAYETEIELATGFLVASSFTRDGLVRDGADPDLVSVVPYGCPEVGDRAPGSPDKSFLFVGQGVERKGLHLLLRAWEQMEHRGFCLQVVSNFLDPGMTALIARCTDLEVLQGLSNDDVRIRMERADTLVLPSLLEGFGLVLGEALAAGCRLIATTHTGLPDMALPATRATTIEVGSVAALRAALTAHMDDYTADPDGRAESLEHARRLGWVGFRRGVRAAVGLEA